MNSMMSQDFSGSVFADDQWWRGGVIYQIYPRSFQDSNGDGIGDLAGITQRLEYVRSLGVDAIWISPFFRSPMKDFGYDVSDYRDVDPMFGTLEDFDALLSKAHDLGLRVMIDLVLSHTSDAHPWFAQSRVSRDNARADWYVWSDPKADGTPPNNWLSIFGGSAWHWDARREQYYLHNFLNSQPDLNFHNADVRAAVLDVARFWLDRGVDGFRLDTINFYYHDAELRSNPALPMEQRNASIAPSVNPYNHQEHLYSKNRPENLAFLEELRALTENYTGIACLGEVGDAQRGLEIMAEYTKGDERMHLCYAFEFLEAEPLTAGKVKAVFDRLAGICEEAWPCWAFSNHDVVRHVSRWGLGEAAARLMPVLMMCLRGTACIYQGEELGLAEADVAFEDLQDPYGIEFWPEFKGRDGCRTPVPWAAQAPSSGFSDGRPWLPVDPGQAALASDRQESDDASMLNHYRRVIAFRRDQGALQSGSVSNLAAEGGLLTFWRRNGAQTMLCAFNLGDAPVTVDVPVGAAAQGVEIGAAQTPELEGWSYGIWQLREG